ncbi:hypothetical protein LSH36_1g22003 [Paralvinella palmiformis]|uniref:BZIP domain-containing protein n=1 Tax=Paralvinella palmiformis TaxID=53620 RepID=A0AAD9KFL3_9ANNE|nr:hypothetical protein LSH36_1g22003 [Paralvinella palmiformis]
MRTRYLRLAEKRLNLADLLAGGDPFVSQTPPETAWMIQDLDMMYPPQDRAPAYQIKDEEVHDACAYANPAVGQLQPSGSTPLGGAPYQNQYGGDGADVDNCFGGEWPADLENIHLDCDLPSEADSPLNLENYNMTKVVFVDPDTQSPNPEAALCAPTYHGNPSTPPKYSNAAPSYHHQNAIYYDQPPLVTMETLQPEVTPVAAITDGQRDRHAPTRRGRPRTEWRINKRGPGRPRNKPGRKPTLGVVKTEIGDNEENMYPDIIEEKRERRREQNRRAARKLREKKKVHVEHMKQFVYLSACHPVCRRPWLSQHVVHSSPAGTSHLCTRL